MIEICTRSPIYLFCLFSLFNKHYANAYIVTRKLTSFRYDFNIRVTIRYKLTLICPIKWHSNKTANIMLKSYQFKTHCKGDSHSSKTANNILPGHMTKQRWTPLRLQAKYNILLGCCFNQRNADEWIWIPFRFQTDQTLRINNFERRFQRLLQE